MQKQIINPIGECLITYQNQALDIDQTQQTIRLGNVCLVPELMTDLDGFYKRPLKYAGHKGKELYFYIGDDDADLFKPIRSYYEVLHYLSEIRFFKLYSSKGGRDYNFKNGKWK